MPVHAVHKRSVARRTVRISGRGTTLALEHAFWDALNQIALAKGTTLTRLLEEIEQTPRTTNLLVGDPAVRAGVLEPVFS
jgi:predicted DNA-binding ribbon-helix-helix protein